MGERLHDEAAIEIDDLLVLIDLLPGVFEYFPCARQADHDPDILQDIHGGIVNILNLVLRKKLYRLECINDFLSW